MHYTFARPGVVERHGHSGQPSEPTSPLPRPTLAPRPELGMIQCNVKRVKSGSAMASKTHFIMTAKDGEGGSKKQRAAAITTQLTAYYVPHDGRSGARRLVCIGSRGPTLPYFHCLTRLNPTSPPCPPPPPTPPPRHLPDERCQAFGADLVDLCHLHGQRVGLGGRCFIAPHLLLRPGGVSSATLTP